MSDRSSLDQPSQSRGGWASGPSIAIELDVALSVIRDYFTFGASMPSEFAQLLRQIPDTWRDEAPPLVQDLHGIAGVLETPAYLAGTAFEGDYGRTTLAIRNTSVESALERLTAEFAPLGISPDPQLPPDRRLVDLGTRGRMALHQAVGFELTPESSLTQSIQREFERAVAILPDSPQYDRFWHWLDRFYLQFYHPWRETRLAHMREQASSLERALGALAAQGTPPKLDWLVPQNPLRLFAGLRQAVESGQTEVYFWIEPFGMADLWSLYPGRVLVAFAEPGVMYENFFAQVQNAAERVKALADPTRLTILRLIRHFGMVNTEIADYLGISRPTVSIHVKILRDAGLVRSEQVGREMRHAVVPSELRKLFRDVESLLDLPEG